MTPFLKEVKRDFVNKAHYFKYVQYKTEMVDPCFCEDKVVHSYCLAIKVIKSRVIAC